jgi:diguanylate cyclase (GGDEF)-like protein/PAS domain S-box-containing protein
MPVAEFDDQANPQDRKTHSAGFDFGVVGSGEPDESRTSDRLQKALYAISESAHTADNLPQLLKQVHAIVLGLLPAQNFYVALYDHETGMIQFPYYVDERENDIPSPTQKFSPEEMEKSLTLYILQNEQALLLSKDDFMDLERAGQIELIGAPCVDWLGVPLRTGEKKIMGVLAVQTYQDGEHYQEADRDILSYVSNQIAMAIDHIRTHEALKKSEERLHLAVEAARFGLWDIDLSEREIVGNTILAEMVAAQELTYPFEKVQRLINFDDFVRMRTGFLAEVNSSKPFFNYEFRARTLRGELKWFQAFGKVSAVNANGHPTRITGMVQDITTRKVAEEKISQRDAVLEAVSFAAEKFLRGSRWEESIHEVLERLGMTTGADRVYLVQVETSDLDEITVHQRDEWVSEGIHPMRTYPKKPGVRHPGLIRWASLLKQGRVIQGNANEFPEAERDFFKSRDISSVIFVPIFADKQWWGFVGFDACDEKKDLSQFEADILRAAANFLGEAIQKQSTEQSLRDSEARQRAILNTQPDVIFIIGLDGKYLDCYTSNLHLLVAPPSEIMGRHLAEFVPQKIADDWISLVGKTLATGEIYTYEYSLFINSVETHFSARFARYDQNSALTVVSDITERKLSEEKIRQVNEKLTIWVNELEERNRQSLLLNKMGDMLQSCLSVDEAYQVIRQYCEQLFEQTTGSVYILNNSKNSLESVVEWGSDPYGEQIFGPDDCWALRRGRLHIVPDPQKGLYCQHLVSDAAVRPSKPYLCIPMIAQGETLGLLHIHCDEVQAIQHWDTLATSVSEQIGLAISNLNLRQLLQGQSIRDSLTNLFNRRYMQETLERELSRAKRFNLPLSVAMADVDHFKKFNDNLGHEAGDMALQEIGALLQRSIRKDDVPCRYGGDELAIILPGASLTDSFERIEQFRQAVKDLRLRHTHDDFGVLTVSLGIAGYPEHGSTVRDLFRAADEALYQAKHDGRDRVVIKI